VLGSYMPMWAAVRLIDEHVDETVDHEETGIAAKVGRSVRVFLCDSYVS
jgi:hypothetical protein